MFSFGLIMVLKPASPEPTLCRRTGVCFLPWAPLLFSVLYKFQVEGQERGVSSRELWWSS